MKRAAWFLLFAFSISTVCAKKVGLVLSGGAARGLTHIGVIKALEENEIPIDYIAGTSMGAIVGSLYAIGYTTDEMIALITSKEFHSWQTGVVASKDQYYYRQADILPNIIELNARWGKEVSLQSYFLPTNVVNPQQMNIAVMELYAPATAACGRDFNNLMVPFRCVASDIFAKKATVMSEGDLGDAVRSSMSFPFMFRPVEIDGKILYDGGIYNNFPVDVMDTTFQPGYIIGSDVGSAPTKPDKRDIFKLIESMIVKRDEQQIDNGLLLRFTLDDVSLWDFQQVNELVKIGYDSTMAHMDEIKASIDRRISKEEISQKRKEFQEKIPPLRFSEIQFKGISPAQQQYIEQSFHHKGVSFGMEEFRKGYFNLISDNVISEIVPHAIYVPEDSSYTLDLQVTTRDQLKVMVGGNISTSTPNQTFIGVRYQNLSSFAQTAWINFHFGRTYNGMNLGTRIDLPQKVYFRPEFVIHRFNYFEDDHLFYFDDRTAFFTQNEIYTKLKVGFPVTMKARLECGAGYGYLRDLYIQDKQLAIEYRNGDDRSSYSLFNVFARIDGNSLNSRMYPTAGRRFLGSLQIVGGNEYFKSSLFPTDDVEGVFGWWVQFRAQYDEYIRLFRHFTLGVSADLAISNRGMLNNYTATLIQAPRFTPTVHSVAIFNEYFSANQFLAVGVKPIYVINDSWHIRAEAYAFAPYRTIMRKADNTAYYGKPFSALRFITELSVNYNFKIATANLYVNYYSMPEKCWNVGRNIGFLIFKERFVE